MRHFPVLAPTSLIKPAAGKLVAASIALTALIATASGQTAPLLRAERLGLFGPEHTGAGGVQSSTVAINTVIRTRFNLAGGYVGSSNRYDATGAANGTNTWYYSRQLRRTVPMGLVGADHTGSSGYQQSQVGALTSSGITFGTSGRLVGERTDNGSDAWAVDTATGLTTVLGLTGSGFTGSQGYRSTSLMFAGENFASGHSNHIAGVNTVDGRSAWLYLPATGATIALGLFDAEHTNASGVGQHSLQSAGSAFVSGTSARTGGPNGTFVGGDLWLYDVNAATTIRLGLSGPTFSNSSTRFVLPSGQVTGLSAKVASDGSGLGMATWVYRPSSGTTAVIGLTDEEHTGSAGYQQGGITVTYPNGESTGTSYQVAGVRSLHGIDTWFESLATGSVRTNLIDAEHTGPNGQHNSENSLIRIDSSSILGRSAPYSASGFENGHDAWIFRPGQGTTVIGLTDGPHIGSAGYREVNFRSATPTGLVLGVSQRITGLSSQNGQSTWLYDSATEQTVQIGLSGSAYRGSAGYQFSDATAFTSTGQAMGTTKRVLNINTDNGANTWVYRANTRETVVTGLTGLAFTGSAGYQYSENFAQIETGVVVGFSRRITGARSTNGQSAWYFDPLTNQSIDVLEGIAETVRSSDNYSFSLINLLTEDGFALGRYTMFAGGSATGSNRLFLFRPDIGFYDLATLAADGLPATGIASLSSLQSANLLGEIIGYGRSEGQPVGSQSAFLFTRVPAPSTALVGALAWGLLSGRRRRSPPR